MTSILRHVLRIAVPVSVENLLASTGTFILTVLLSQIGENAVAINGVANQASFLVLLFLFGLNSGGAIFLAQFWGLKDTESIAKISTLMLLFSLLISSVFFIITFFFPSTFISVFSKDLSQLGEAVEFLKIISFSHFAVALEVVLRTYLRSTERAIIPMESYIVGTAVQLVMAFGFLKGVLGFPKLGTIGVAWALTVSRYVIPVYQLIRTSLSGRKLRFLDLRISKAYLSQFLKYASPTTLNEIAWSLGMTAYGVIFGRMGTDVYAARNVLSSFENYVWTFTFGLVISCAVLVGKKIGAMEYEEASKFAKRMIKMNVLVSVFSAALIMVIYYAILPKFNLTDTTKKMLTTAMWVMFVGAPIKAFNGMAVVGVLRAGGDAKFAFLLETSTLWGLGVPSVYIGAFVLKQPLPVVYALTLTDEVAKGIIAFLRIRSHKWIRNVASETQSKVASLVEHGV